MDYSYQNAVIIGRFQPFHNSHLELVKQAFTLAPKVTVVVGSAFAAPTIKNPFTFEERKKMIESCFWPRQLPTVVGVRDYYYNENAWLSDVQAKTDFPQGTSVALVGSYKDGSSYYLKSFPQWDFVAHKTTDLDLDSASIRDTLFHADGKPVMLDWEGKAKYPEQALHTIKGLLPDIVHERLKEWVKTPVYGSLMKEYEYIAKYKAEWKSAPFPPTFNTVDAVVVCSGHVLIVERLMNPGKGLYALPGGFLMQKETTQNGMLRELKEETGIRLDKRILASSIVAAHVFDHPDRSLRGRTITHGFYLKLKDGPLPEVTGGDDAARAFWIPLWDVARYAERFMEDHASIITFFTSKS